MTPTPHKFIRPRTFLTWAYPLHFEAGRVELVPAPHRPEVVTLREVTIPAGVTLTIKREDDEL